MGVVAVFFIVWNNCSRTLVFSSFLIIVKSLQLRGRRQIAEPRKYCLVRVIFFLWRLFSLFFFFFLVSHRLGIWVKFPTTGIRV